MEEAQKNWPPAEQRKFEGESLNNCPFCGNSFLEIKDDCGFTVNCNDCEAKGPECDTEAQAREKWNERAMPH